MNKNYTLEEVIRFKRYMVEKSDVYIQLQKIKSIIAGYKVDDYKSEKKIVHFMSLGILMYGVFGLILRLCFENNLSVDMFQKIYNTCFLGYKFEYVLIGLGLAYFFIAMIIFHFKSNYQFHKLIFYKEVRNAIVEELKEYYFDYKEQPPVMFELSNPEILSILISEQMQHNVDLQGAIDNFVQRESKKKREKC